MEDGYDWEVVDPYDLDISKACRGDAAVFTIEAPRSGTYDLLAELRGVDDPSDVRRTSELHLSFTGEKSGHAERFEAELRLGDVYEIGLSANPSTGYAWRAVNPDPSLTIRSVFSDNTYSPGISGAGGTETFRISAEKAGSYTVHLVYGRAWEPAPARDVFVHLLFCRRDPHASCGRPEDGGTGGLGASS